MAVPEELVWLIAQLRGTASRRERIRLLARGWRTLKELSPTDRMVVAHELGFDGAEKLVEQLSRRSGASPTTVLELLERAEEAGPEQIVAMVQDLSDPEGRRSLGERFISAARTWVTDLESWEGEPRDHEAVDTPAANTLKDSEEAQLDGSASTVFAQEPPPPPKGNDHEPDDLVFPSKMTGLPEEAREEDKAEDLSELEYDEAVAETVGIEPGFKTEDPEPDGDGPVQPHEEPLHPPEAEPVGTPPEPQSRAPERDRPDSQTTDVEGLIRRLEGLPSVTRRLRELSELAHEMVDADRAEAVSVLGLFPDGWARRRALEALFRAGVPRRSEVALSLAASLEDPVQRIWALSTLVSTRHLTPGQLDAVLSVAPTPALRRRLKRLGAASEVSQ